MLSRFRPVLILMIWLASAGQAIAGDLMVVTEDIAPYSYREDGEVKGMSTEVVEAVLEGAGYRAKIEVLPWARSFHLAQTRPNTLLYSVIRTPEREEMFAWIGAVAPYRVSLYKLADNDAIALTTLDEAKPYRVGVYLADAKHDYLTNRGFQNLDPVESDVFNLRKLLLGRIDLMAIDDAALGQLLKSEGVEPTRLQRAVSIPELSGETYLAINKTSDADLITALQDSLTALTANGDRARILAQYILP